MLDGQNLEEKVGETFQLLTVGEDDWPNVSLLSAGEVLAASEAELRLALWPNTRTTANLARSGRGILTCVLKCTAYNVKLSTTSVPWGDTSLSCFACRVEAVESDTVDYAKLESGIRFRLKDSPEVVDRWRRTLELLRQREDSASDR